MGERVQKPRPGGSPRKRARREAIERGELVPGESSMAAARRTGPASKLTPELQDRIVRFVRAGNFIETAASAAGINRGTIRVWMDRGARAAERADAGEEITLEDSDYIAFRNAVETAMGEAEAHDVASIRRAGTDHEHTTTEYDADGKAIKRVVRTERGDFRALTWRLEHMHGDKYTQRIKIEVESQLSDMLDFLETAIPPEAYRHVIEALAKRASAQAT